ncbi:hypothetical protein KZX45_09450 [Georgenia sp. EYE_87]|uniref:hypothetical protein n=1 Tax=Georgenia sp. EYE_87 TaxID=2853448 RepID=UPI002006626F|nr:hypothetical protein [Georgenia sp. EYE_87]MCK6210765.1 hypothetical protein [Georgenia sp. EYE_87]
MKRTHISAAAVLAVAVVGGLAAPASAVVTERLTIQVRVTHDDGTGVLEDPSLVAPIVVDLDDAPVPAAVATTVAEGGTALEEVITFVYDLPEGASISLPDEVPGYLLSHDGTGVDGDGDGSWDGETWSVSYDDVAPTVRLALRIDDLAWYDPAEFSISVGGQASEPVLTGESVDEADGLYGWYVSREWTVDAGHLDVTVTYPEGDYELRPAGPNEDGGPVGLAEGLDLAAGSQQSYELELVYVGEPLEELLTPGTPKAPVYKGRSTRTVASIEIPEVEGIDYYVYLVEEDRWFLAHHGSYWVSQLGATFENPYVVVAAEPQYGYDWPVLTDDLPEDLFWIIGVDPAMTLLTPAAPPAEPRYGFFLNDAWTAKANHLFQYGRHTDQVLVGDWDGDGSDTIMVRRGNLYYVNNKLGGGEAERVFAYGRADDVVLVGDWDGDGKDTLAVRRGSAYHVKNDVSSGPADRVVVYGRAGDEVLVGDWDGDGDDTLTVRRGSIYHVKNSIAAGAADRVVPYGRATDAVVVGDWDGDRTDTFTVRRGNVYHVKNTLGGGAADLVLAYGRADDVVRVGDWDGDGEDTLGVRRLP